MVSQTVRRLRIARENEWSKLQPAFDWAIHEAIEAEYRANVAADAALTNVEPKYPTIVRLLAEAINEEDYQ